jgi:hypothetical protein
MRDLITARAGGLRLARGAGEHSTIQKENVHLPVICITVR